VQHSASLLQTICATEEGIRALEHCDDALLRLRALEQDLASKVQKEILKRYVQYGYEATRGWMTRSFTAPLMRCSTALQADPAASACSVPSQETVLCGRLFHLGLCCCSCCCLSFAAPRAPRHFATPRDRSAAEKKPLPIQLEEGGLCQASSRSAKAVLTWGLAPAS